MRRKRKVQIMQETNSFYLMLTLLKWEHHRLHESPGMRLRRSPFDLCCVHAVYMICWSVHPSIIYHALVLCRVTGAYPSWHWGERHGTPRTCQWFIAGLTFRDEHAHIYTSKGTLESPIQPCTCLDYGRKLENVQTPHGKAPTRGSNPSHKCNKFIRLFTGCHT